MALSWQALVTILGMMAVTYFTRVVGYFVLRHRILSARARKVMDTAPACVLLSVIAPHFVSDKPHEWVVLVVTLFSASRWGMLPTVLLAVSSSALFAHLLA